MKVGILTSGGDCSALNAVMRGFVKYVFNEIEGVEVYGFLNGYAGLMNREYISVAPETVEDILDKGGTILGTSRQPYKLMTVSENGEPTKLSIMVENYKKLGLDALITLGGAGTHKTAALLSIEGCNVIGLPKTIDNDIFGTDFTFGFHTAVEVASEAISRVETTAQSHGRAIFVEVMGNKVGWLTLYAGLASGADGVIIPEIPYNEDNLAAFLRDRLAKKRYAVIAVAEGAMSEAEAALPKKERKEYMAALPVKSVAARLADKYAAMGLPTRSVVLGHVQRGGSPTAYDKVLSMEIGEQGGYLLKNGIFGVSVAFVGNRMTYNALTDIAGLAKYVPADAQLIELAKGAGVYFGN